MKSKPSKIIALARTMQDLRGMGFNVREVQLWKGNKYLVSRLTGVGASGFDTYDLLATVTLTPDGPVTGAKCVEGACIGKQVTSDYKRHLAGNDSVRYFANASTLHSWLLKTDLYHIGPYDGADVWRQLFTDGECWHICTYTDGTSHACRQEA